MDERSIAIFYWEGLLSITPSLINAIRCLSDAGYRVDVILRPPEWDFPDLPSFPSNVRILWVLPRPSRDNTDGEHSTHVRHDQPNEDLSLIRRSVQRLQHLVKAQWLIAVVLGLINPLQFIGFGLRVTRHERFTCFIGVDGAGLIAASAVALIRRVPVLYWSTELTFLKDFGDPINRLTKRLEKVCHRRAQFTIIQSAERAQALMTENAVASSRVVIVPNGPLGPPKKLSSDYFQRKFDLRCSQKIILHAGMIAPDALAEELAREASTWPDEWTLIFHESFRRDPSDLYVRNIQVAGGDRIRLSLDPVPYDELDFLIASAHVGVVLYDTTLGPNFALMAGASGKLGQYLRCGLPVVCLAPPGVTEPIRDYRSGLVVEDLRNVRSAVEGIFKDYTDYSANAFRCYEEIYEFGARFRQVVDEIRTLDRQRGGRS